MQIAYISRILFISKELLINQSLIYLICYKQGYIINSYSYLLKLQALIAKQSQILLNLNMQARQLLALIAFIMLIASLILIALIASIIPK